MYSLNSWIDILGIKKQKQNTKKTNMATIDIFQHMHLASLGFVYVLYLSDVWACTKRIHSTKSKWQARGIFHSQSDNFFSVRVYVYVCVCLGLCM